MLKIGDFSILSRVSIRMLRHYDKLGLLTPETTDSFTGYRYYAESQLTVVNRITSLKSLGFSLAGVAQLLQYYDDPEALEQHLQVKRLELHEQLENDAMRLRLLDTAIERLRKDNTMSQYNVTLKELPARHVASVRKTIPAYDQECILWDILMQESAPLHMQNDNPCYTLAIFHDGQYKESDVDVEVQMSVKGTYPNTEHIVFKTEPSVLIASATYQGSYEKINEVNMAVADWVKDNGYDFNGLSFSIYHVSPHETQNPDEFVTEVCYPVRKK